MNLIETNHLTSKDGKWAIMMVAMVDCILQLNHKYTKRLLPFLLKTAFYLGSFDNLWQFDSATLHQSQNDDWIYTDKSSISLRASLWCSFLFWIKGVNEFAS